MSDRSLPGLLELVVHCSDHVLENYLEVEAAVEIAGTRYNLLVWAVQARVVYLDVGEAASSEEQL